MSVKLTLLWLDFFFSNSNTRARWRSSCHEGKVLHSGWVSGLYKGSHFTSFWDLYLIGSQNSVVKKCNNQSAICCCVYSFHLISLREWFLNWFLRHSAPLHSNYPPWFCCSTCLDELDEVSPTIDWNILEHAVKEDFTVALLKSYSLLEIYLNLLIKIFFHCTCTIFHLSNIQIINNNVTFSRKCAFCHLCR